MKYVLKILVLILISQDISSAAELELCKAIRIVTGDTIEVIYRDEKEKVRLYGIDTPERGEPGFEEASQAMAALVLFENVFIDFPAKHKRDNFGRLLANIYVHSLFVNNSMVEMEYAKMYRATKEEFTKYNNPTLLDDQIRYIIDNNDINSINAILNKDNFTYNPKAHKFTEEYRKDQLSSTLREACTRSQHPEMIKALINLGADINHKYIENITPLHAAAAFNKNPEIISCLIELGADTTAIDDLGQTPLQTAQNAKNNPAITAIIKAKSDT